MAPDTIIEVHLDGTWVPAALLRARKDGGVDVDYLASYVFSDEPQPLALGLPVQLPAYAAAAEDELSAPRHPRMPAFLYDLVPQGAGRRFLLRKLGLPDADHVLAPLLMAGAFNPIGRLRVRSAVEFFDRERQSEGEGSEQSLLANGFSMSQILHREEAFVEHLQLHGMLAAGTTGVQGVAPKFLLTQDAQGRWYADAALPDERAQTHWLAKLPRGRTAADQLVHRHEAIYLQLADVAGLRCHDKPVMVGDILFVKRFDREVTASGAVTRLHQESLASLAGLEGFAPATTHNELVAAVRRHATDPKAEILEYLKRDLFSLALRNTDNHARNTAVQVRRDGVVALTPVFDLCPMYLDPEIVARSVHWRRPQGGRMSDLREIISEIFFADEIDFALDGLEQFAARLAGLREAAKQLDADQRIIEGVSLSLDEQLRRLSDLPAPPGAAARRRDAPRA